MAQLREDEVRQAFATFTQAMMDGDTGTLQILTSANFRLTHLTGYVQPRNEWLSEIEQKRFVYYSIDTQDIRVSEVGEQLVARTLTDARVDGARNTWKLQLALNYTSHKGQWIADMAVASLWT